MDPNRHNDVTLLIPSVASRAHLFRRVLTHLEYHQFHSPIVVSDHSASEEHHVLAGIADDFPHLNLTLLHHPTEMPFLARLAKSAETTSTRYAAVHADDDFMHPDALASCVKFLDSNLNYSAAKGRIAFFHVKDGVLKQGNLQINPQRSWSRENSSVHERLMHHLNGFSATLYAVHRRDQFIKNCHRTLEATQNVIFWQYLSSCITLIQGKLKTLNNLYYLRQQNPHGWQVNLIQERDPEHWPYLILSPNFSRHLNDFKSGLLSALTDSPEPPPKDFAEKFDDALIWLLRHGLAKQRTDSPEENEDEIYKRLEDSASTEARFLGTCLVMTIAPDRLRVGASNLQAGSSFL